MPMQSFAYAMLTYAFCNLIEALKFVSSFISSDKNVTQNTRPSLYTYVKIAMRLTLEVHFDRLHCA